jgi:hypothetical protein
VALSFEDQSELNRRADRLSSLVNHPGWIEFEAENKRKIERLKKECARLALDPAGADQRKLDVIRGNIAMLRWQDGLPYHAKKTLKDFLEEQGIEVDEMEDEDERDRAGVG